jgi:hypothetical protein
MSNRQSRFGAVVASALVAVAAIAVLSLLLRDHTQSQPEADDFASVDVVRVRVRTNFGLDAAIAMDSLWHACNIVVEGTRLARPITRLDDTDFELVLEPSMGEQARRRLRGCINDGTLDRVKSHFVELRSEPRVSS